MKALRHTTAPLGTGRENFKMSEETQTATQSVSILSMAKKVHDELIAEAKQKAHTLVEEAQAKAAGLVANAQREADEKLSGLASEHMELTERILELQKFEKHYRQRLQQLVDSAHKTLEEDENLNGEHSPEREEHGREEHGCTHEQEHEERGGCEHEGHEEHQD